MNLAVLPSVNAVLNSCSAFLLILGYFFIRRQNVAAHRLCMCAAFLTSSIFLASYLYYHYHHGSTRFQGQGVIRAVYFTILISHTILAVAIVPLIFRTFYLAIKGAFERHRKIARVTLPFWLYVSVTGVVVYWMLYRL